MGYWRRGNGIVTAFCCAFNPLLMRQETDYLTSDKSRPNPGERDVTAVTTDCLQHSTQARAPDTLRSQALAQSSAHSISFQGALTGRNGQPLPNGNPPRNWSVAAVGSLVYE